MWKVDKINVVEKLAVFHQHQSIHNSHRSRKVRLLSQVRLLTDHIASTREWTIAATRKVLAFRDIRFGQVQLTSPLTASRGHNVCERGVQNLDCQTRAGDMLCCMPLSSSHPLILIYQHAELICLLYCHCRVT